MAVVNNNLSSLIGFQLTEAFRNENPQFVTFLKSYYQFLESIQLCFTSVTGSFIEGEIITGGTSNATAKILSIDTTKTIGTGIYVYISQTNNVIFSKGETITGSGGASGVLSHYRRNPLNAVKMIFDWNDITSPNNDLIYNFRYELFENFPEDLQIDKSLFIKNIKELYLEKGDERSFQTLFRMAYGTENLEFYYPKTDILKPSSGEWVRNLTLQIAQTTINYGFLANKILGQTSSATAFVEELALKKVSTVNVIELYLKNIIGKFLVGETIRLQSPDNISANTTFAAITTTTLGIISTDPAANSVNIVTAGNGYVVDQNLPLSQTEGVGASLRVGTTTNDQVVYIAPNTGKGGGGYQLGDKVDFDNTIANPSISATAEVGSLTSGSTINVNNEKIYELSNTHVMTLSTETDIPIRDGFLLSNYSIYDNVTYSTKRGVVVDAISNTVIRYSSTQGNIFEGTDVVTAFREDGFSYTPSLNSTVSTTSTRFSNDVTIGGDYAGNSANTNFVPIFTSNTSTSTLTGAFSFSDKTVGAINSINVTRYGEGYNATPTISIKTNQNYQEVNDYPDSGYGNLGNNSIISITAMGGGVTAVAVDNPGAAFGTVVPIIDFSGYGDGNANGVIVMDALRFYDGYYKGADGQLSSQKKIQDSKYYQDFSYVVQSDTSIERYRDLVLNTIHPGGMELFGEVIIRNYLNLGMLNQGKSNINALDSTGTAIYRSLFRQIINNTSVKHSSISINELKLQIVGLTYIDGVVLKDGTTSSVASNGIVTDQVKNENHIEKSYDDVRFWSDMQKHTWSSAITTKYEITTYDLYEVYITDVATTVSIVKSYEPGTLSVFIDDKAIPYSDIVQSDGNDFTIPIPAALKHSEQIRVIESYIKIPLDAINGYAYLNENDYVYLEDGSSNTRTSGTHTFGDQVYNQKFKIKRTSDYETSKNVILFQEDGLPLLHDYSSYSSSSGYVWRSSKDLWSKSIIEMLSEQRIGYYGETKIINYNFDHTINNLTSIYSSGNDIFIDREFISIDEELIMEDGAFIGGGNMSGDTIGVEGNVSKYNTEGKLFTKDYQFYTLNSSSTNKLSLNQFVNWEINRIKDDISFSYGTGPQTFSLQNISTMKRT